MQRQEKITVNAELVFCFLFIRMKIGSYLSNKRQKSHMREQNPQLRKIHLTKRKIIHSLGDKNLRLRSKRDLASSILLVSTRHWMTVDHMRGELRNCFNTVLSTSFKSWRSHSREKKKNWRRKPRNDSYSNQHRKHLHRNNPWSIHPLKETKEREKKIHEVTSGKSWALCKIRITWSEMVSSSFWSRPCW